MATFKKVLHEIGNAFVDDASGLPLMKTFNNLLNIWNKIQDEDKLFTVLIHEVYTQTLLEALKKYDYKPKFENRKLYERSLMGYFEEADFKAEEFDLSNFNGNEIIQVAHENNIGNLLKYWAELEESESNALDTFVHRRVESNFYKVLREKPDTYQKIKTYFDSKQYKVGNQLFKRKSYENALKALYTNKGLMGDEEIALEDLYIEPHFQIHENSLSNEVFEWESIETENDYWALESSLHPFVHHLLNPQKTELEVDTTKILKKDSQRVILILGEPGQGKTSWCKRFLYDCLTEKHYQQEVYYVKLRHVTHVKDLMNSPLPTLLEEAQAQKHQVEGFKIAEEDFKKGILILDGLDELYMKEGFQGEQVRKFLKDLVEICNPIKNAALKIIITSRFGPITPEEISREKILVLRLSSLTLAQQQTWLKKYKFFDSETPLNSAYLEELNQTEDENKGIAELICQPVLLHIIAQLPDKINPESNKADIYNQLFDMLTQRSYDSTGMLDWHKDLCECLDIDDFADYLRELIREIAFAIFLTGHDYINKNELYRSPTAKLQEFFDTLEKLKVSPEDALKTLMVSFYIQEVQPQEELEEGKADPIRSNYALEFLHKSLQEYLIAEYLWESILELTDKTSSSRRKKEEYSIKEGKNALKLCTDLFAARRIGAEGHQVVDDLIQIIERESQELRQELQNRLLHFLGYCTENDFLLQYESENVPKLSPIEIAKNVFYGYWTMLSYGKIESLEIENVKKRIVYFLKIGSYYRLNLSQTDLRGADLMEAVLSRADLRGANLSRANLSRADLIRADLSGANLSGVVLRGAVLIEAVLMEAVLMEAVLMEAVLMEAVLRGADLIEAVLRGADLRGADLSRADLRGADLRGADLRGADLRGADLMEAITDDSQFFKTLQEQNCKGVAELMTKYQLEELEKDGETWYRIVLKNS